MPNTSPTVSGSKKPLRARVTLPLADQRQRELEDLVRRLSGRISYHDQELERLLAPDPVVHDWEDLDEAFDLHADRRARLLRVKQHASGRLVMTLQIEDAA